MLKASHPDLKFSITVSKNIFFEVVKVIYQTIRDDLIMYCDNNSYFLYV